LKIKFKIIDLLHQAKYLKTLGLIAVFVFTTTIKGQNGNHNWQGFGSVTKGMAYNDYLNTVFHDTIDDLLYMGGLFTNVNNHFTPCIAAWNGTQWNPLDSGTYDNVWAITRYQNKIYVGGQFRSVDYDNIPANGIATWDGSQWDSLPISFKNNGNVLGFKEYNNELYVFGSFDTIGNIAMNSLAKWNGSQWSDVYNLPNFASGNSIQGINEIEFYNGNLYIGGNFYNPTNNIRDIAMYDGTNWVSVGPAPGMYGGLNYIHDMEIYKGDLYVAGSIYKSAGNVGNFIQRWDGSQWHEVGGSLWGTQARCLLAHKDYLYVGGEFGWAGEDSIPAYSLARWDGSQWCAYDSYINASVIDLAIYKDTLIVAGGFSTIAGDTIHKIAKYTNGNWVDSCGALVGINNPLPNTQNSILIYPNPANASVTIVTADDITEVKFYNALGQVVLSNTSMNNSKKVILNVQAYPMGMYTIQVKTRENQLLHQKLIIQ